MRDAAARLANAQSSRPRRLRPRRPGAGRSSTEERIFRHALRPPLRLRRPAPADRDRGRQDARREVWSLQDAREVLTRIVGRDRRLDAARRLAVAVSGDRRTCAPASRPAASAPASNSPAKDGSISARPRPSPALHARPRPGRARINGGPEMANAECRRHDRRRQRRRRVEPVAGGPPAEPAHGRGAAVRLRRAALGRGARRPAARGRRRRRLLRDLSETYAERGVNLVQVAGKWSFRTAGDLSFLLSARRSSSASCRAPRWRRWRSSPTTSR
jgi:hypothetical protein